jgi:asparagine N-glycosylation enzyme membrane subunit Stt3
VVTLRVHDANESKKEGENQVDTEQQSSELESIVFSETDAISLVAESFYDGEAEDLTSVVLKEKVAYIISKFNKELEYVEEEFIVAEGEIKDIYNDDLSDEGIRAYEEVILSYNPDYYTVAGSVKADDYDSTEVVESDGAEEDIEQVGHDIADMFEISDLTSEHAYDTTFEVSFKVTNKTNSDHFITVKISNVDANGKALTSKEVWVSVAANEYKYESTYMDTNGNPNVTGVRVDIIEY